MPSQTVQYGTARAHSFSLIIISAASTHCSSFCCQGRSKVCYFYLITGQTYQLTKGATALREEQLLLRDYPTISVVIPALNEAQNLRYVLPLIPTLASEVILVDEHSTDDTVVVAQRILPTIRIIKQNGKGKGNALTTGFAACTGDIIVMLDADGSANPQEIPLFIEALLEGFDFAKGSRFLQGGGSHDITYLRQLGNYGLSRFVNLLFWTRFSDLCYGYNAFWKHCLDYIHIDCDGFEIETLMHLRVHQAKLKIVEIPSFEHPRIFGKSNLHTFRDGWRVLKTVVQERTRKALPQIQSPQPGATSSVSYAQQHTSSLFFRGRVLSTAPVAEVFPPDEKA